MSYQIKHLCLLFFLIAFGACQKDSNRTDTSIPEAIFDPEEAVFRLVPPAHSNVDFSNTLTESLNTNVMMYEYFYNGGGVATADFNGDDLVDIYFTSNMGDNKFYLNKGDLKFKDITTLSGASGRPGPWKTGVSIVDINGDQKLDLYLCYSGALPDEKRANQLFINQGNDENNNPIFKEEAEKYGLNSQAYSNQSYFLDYDQDGDLDMLLLNHNPKSLPNLNETSTSKYMAEDVPMIGVRLFSQSNGSFADVTIQSKISGSALTYGLGLGISDLNADGWPDFYISNDYAIPDYLYINNQDGTFSNQLQESVRYNSQFSMGNDIADINNDGLSDILTLDMLPEQKKRQRLLMAPDNYSKFDLNVRNGFYHQFMRNMLQLNNGNGTFTEVGQFAGIPATDWSWAALLADYNNDGWKDLYVTNGYHKDYTNLDFISYMDDFVQKKGRLQREDVMTLIEKMPASDVVNYMYENDQNLSFTNVTKSWGLNHVSNSNGAAYADLDNDGDLDLVVNNINKAAFIFENKSEQEIGCNYLQIMLNGTGMNSKGIGSKVKIYSKGKIQSIEQFPSRGYLSAISPVLHFGLGDQQNIDSLIITWPSEKTQKRTNIKVNQRIRLDEANASIQKIKENNLRSLFSLIPSPIKYENPKQYIRDFDRQSLLISELSHQGPCMAKGDLNSDGLEDIVIGGSHRQAANVYLQNPNGKFALSENSTFDVDRNCEDSNIAVFDANGDGDLDIYITSGGYHLFKSSDPLLQDRIYLNDGQGRFQKSLGALPEMFTSTSVVAVNDINEDGFPDLFLGGRLIPGRYPETPNSYFLMNNGQGEFTDQTKEVCSELSQFGMITDAKWVDVNDDTKKDLVVVGDWLPLSIFISENGKLKNRTTEYFDQEYVGWWNTISIGNFNNDQRPDFLFGNTGTNTPFKISVEEPAELYFNDFDSNGSVDPFFTFYTNGKSYPYLTRDDLLGQMARLRSKFTSYESYAEATMNDLFSKKELGDAKHLVANQMETSLFLSTPSNVYKHALLPKEVQYAPIHSVFNFDYDGDGHEDLILCGNNSRAQLRIGKLDSNYGMLMKGNGKGVFEYIDQTTSGFNLKGDVRAGIMINDKILFGINQQALVTYKMN